MGSGPENVVVFDKFEVEEEGIIKAKVGLYNRMIINWTYKLLGDSKQRFRLRRIPLETGRARIGRSVELPTILILILIIILILILAATVT